MQSQLLSIPEFCRDNKVSRSYAYRMLGNGTLKGVKVGRLTRIGREDAEAWVTKLQCYRSAP